MFSKIKLAAVVALSFAALSISQPASSAIFIKYKDVLRRPEVKESIVDLAAVLAVWNDSMEETEYRRLLARRVLDQGVEAGLVSPALVLLDTAMISGKPQIAALISPSINRLSPDLARQLQRDLGLPTSHHDRATSVKAQAEKVIGPRSRKSFDAADVTMERSFGKVDPTGMASKILGPRAYVRERSSGDQERGPSLREAQSSSEKRSPIFGMTKKEIIACAASCVDKGVKAGERGAHVGVTVGTAIGFVAGTVTTGVGGVAGAGLGAAIGWSGGKVYWGGIHAVACAADCGPKTTKSPKSEKPAPSNPSPSGGSDTDGTPGEKPEKPEPRTTTGGGDSMGGSPRAGGGGSCEYPCNTARVSNNPEDGPINDDTPGSDTGSDPNDPPSDLDADQFEVPVRNFRKNPVINPVRPGYERGERAGISVGGNQR